jgi:hypothetical protein
VPRCRLSRSAFFGGARVAAACAVLGGASAWAQVIPPSSDPLAPKQQTDPRNPPRFQKFNRAPYAQAPGTAVFAPASGAGRTGFDSTNARKKALPRTARGAAAAKAQAVAPGLPPPATVSLYQRPAATGVYAQAPGTPPVPELGPIRKPPPKRKRVEPDDPYAQLGLHAGSFTLYPAIELIGGYDTNPGRGPNGQAAKLYTVAPELRAQSNWSRHELKADLRGSYTGYSPDQTPTLSRPNFNGKVDGRVDVTRATRIDLGGRALVGTDNPGSPNLQAGLSKLPIFTTFGGSAGLGHRFNRFDVSIKGDVERTVYQDSQLTDGTTASNEGRNYNQYGGKLRGGYELSPGLMPFVEAGVDTRKHDLDTDISGYRRNSNGWNGSAGATFELTRLLTGEASLGYVRRTYDDQRLDKIGGLIGNASLIWTASSLTTVKFTAATAVGESTVPGVSGTLYRDAGLQVDHSFRRWLVGSLKVGFGLDDYVGLDRTDTRYSAGAGLTYKVDRSLQVKGEFRQQWLRSNVTGVDYTASIFLVGLRWQH